MRTNLLRAAETSKQNAPDREPSAEEQLQGEVSLRAELVDAITDNLEVWIERLGNFCWVHGTVTGQESGTVTRGAAVLWIEPDGCRRMTFFETNETEEWRTSDLLALRLYPSQLPEPGEAATIDLAKAAACTDWRTAKPMDPDQFQRAAWATGPPELPRFYTLRPIPVDRPDDR